MDQRAVDLGLTRPEWGSVQALCQRNENAVLSRQDLEQECLLELWRIFNLYQARNIQIRNRGGFVYWVSRCAILKRAGCDPHHRINDALFHSNIHATNGEDFSSDNGIAEGEVIWDQLDEIGEKVSEWQYDIMDVARIVSEFLTEREADLLQRLFIEGQKQKDVARVWGVSPERIYQLKEVLLHKLRYYLDEDIDNGTVRGTDAGGAGAAATSGTEGTGGQTEEEAPGENADAAQSEPAGCLAEVAGSHRPGIGNSGL